MKENAIGHLVKTNPIKSNFNDYQTQSNPIKPNFKPDDSFSPQGIPGTAYYTRGYHVAEFILSLCPRCAAEGGLAMAFFGAFPQRVAARPEKNVGTMNLLAIKSYRIYLNRFLLWSN